MKKTNENGITLIALVVTIVVLLILAGITITYVLADGGVFGTAKDAADATVAGQIQDYASQVQATVMMQCTVKNSVGTTPATDGGVDATDKTLSGTELQKFFPADLFTVEGTESIAVDTDAAKVTDNESFTVKSIKNNKNYTVTYKSGTATVGKGVDAGAGA